MVGIADRVFDAISGSKMAFFVGRSDTGKSTLIKHIARDLDVSVIDADIGQSDIGPPTVVSLGVRRGESYRMADGYFCGSTTPARYFLQLISGTARMSKRVKKYPVLVNTTGLATGEVGRALKTEKINALAPDLIVGIGDGLEYLDAFARAGATVLHLPVSPLVKLKSPSERAVLRQKAFRDHFKDASSITFPFKRFSVERSLLFNGTRPRVAGDVLRLDVSGNEALVVASAGLWGLKELMNTLNVAILHVYASGDFKNALVGLLDGRGKFLGLGIIEALDFDDEKAHLYTAVSSFSVLQFGSIKLDLKDFHYTGPFSGHTLRA
ncbi:MAG TPA: Clp1/GlmU family protein [Methanocella sp.]|nr:Clp1/GlmU family protein [Methanocella sp.]